jgi:signal peptidase I
MRLLTFCSPALRWRRVVRKRSSVLLLRIGATLAVVAAGAAALLVLGLTAGPRTGLYATYTVLSESMEPAIPRGSVVVVMPVSPDQLRVGDVITFGSGAPPFPTLTHRVVSVEQDGQALTFRTKGDADLLPDPWKVSYTGQAGLVALTVPLAGYAISALASAAVRFGLGALFVALLAVSWLLFVWARPRIGRELQRLTAAAESHESEGSFSPVRAAILGWVVASLLSRSLER